MASAHDFSFTGIDGKQINLKDYAGRPVLVVNVASLCGFTPQYSELHALHEKYGPKQSSFKRNCLNGGGSAPHQSSSLA